MPFQGYQLGEVTKLGKAIYQEKISIWWSRRKKESSSS